MRSRDSTKAIVIGAGPSKEKNLELVKKFDGIIISTDFMLKHCVKAGIIPHYVCTGENTKRISEFFIREGLHDSPGVPDLDKYCKEIVCVTSNKTHEEVREIIKLRNFKEIVVCEDDEINRSSNVGLMCYIYAWKYLKCKEVVLVGMDHAKPEGWKPPIDIPEMVLYHHSVFKTSQFMDPTFQFFRKEFLDTSEKKPCRTINCTEGGTIEGPGIECMRLEQYLES